MKRRAVLAGLLAVTPGCVSPLGADSDGDGTPDGDDAAPHDPRASDWVGGDPGPQVEIDRIDSADDSTMTIRVVHAGGQPFTPDNTRRLELANRGEPLATIALPFEVGDARTKRVPVVGHVTALWFPPASSSVESPLVVSTTGNLGRTD
ncbi:MAG: hypothetical protein ABEH77_07110 [Halobacteriaceae archaeon]